MAATPLPPLRPYMKIYWGMLKAPPLIPRAYISRSSKIDPTEGRKYVQKYVQKYD